MRNVVSVLLLSLSLHQTGAADKGRWWSDEVEQSLGRAGDNRAELTRALNGVPMEQRKEMSFLLTHLSESDCKSLRGDFLLENVALACKARKELPWGRKVPDDIFLNDVLPHANMDEARDSWRKEMYDLCLPLVKDCKTPGEAAQVLNSTIFAKLKVRYSTERKKANQSPKESIETGKASCSGLSILLCDACRSVGVPARLAGTPLWSNKRGNHTWVEVWDNGWHFTGAAEPDPKGLDRAWFQGDAAEAQADSRLHSIYAVSFKKTNVTFPLVWASERKDIYAENVTARYVKPRPVIANAARVEIRVCQSGMKKRLALPVVVVDRQDPKVIFSGDSRGETADSNDILFFELAPNRDYVLRVGKPVLLEQPFKTTAEKRQLVEVEVQAQRTREPAKEPLEQVEKAALAFFSAKEAERVKYTFDPALEQLLAAQEEAVRRAVWKAYQAAPIHDALKKDFEKKEVRHDKLVSPYVVKKVGKRAEKGWPLFIAMHGGGGVPKSVNDSQWKMMQSYYKDQDSVTGYQYLALRAPNDAWNGFYDDNMTRIIVNLVRQFVLLGDVDPDKVFLMGYSHGGYGAFYLGPKVPDRFAAIHSSAAAPSDGSISPRTLRNTRFTFMIGDKDTAYGRFERCEKFNAAVQKLKDENKGEFPVDMQLMKGFGHGLPDHDKIKDMYPAIRNPVPRRLSWDLTDSVVSNFFWLSVPEPGGNRSLDATISDKAIEIKTRNVKEFELLLDGRLVKLDRPQRVVVDGKAQEVKLTPRLATLCQSLLERGDPNLAFSCRVRLSAPPRD
jgi:predicted peptidase